MADTIREQIIAGFMTRLADMTVENGYAVGAGANVFRAYKHLDPGDAPASILWPGMEEAAKNYGQHECTMQIKVEAIADIGADNPSVVQERILGDLKQCLFATDLNFTDEFYIDDEVAVHIDGLVYTSGGPAEFPASEDTLAAVFIEFNIKYNEQVGEPYLL